MKYGKRLLAVMMVLVMVLTIVPLTMFAFATSGTGTSSTDSIMIENYTDLKDVLEGLGSATYPADAFYKLADDIDSLHDWVFASEANRIKAAEDLGMSPVVTPATYAKATEADRTNDTPIYSKEGDVYTLYEGARDADTIPDITVYWVRTAEETSTDAPLTEEQFAAITSADRQTILQNNSDVVPVITPKNVDFLGTFDGDNKTIKGLRIQTNAKEAGMFINVAKDGDKVGTVRNFTIDDTSVIGIVSAVNSVSISIGSVAGTNAGIVQNITSNATVNVMVKLPATAFVGGIVGSNGDSSKGCALTNCTFGGTINFVVAEASFSGDDSLSIIDISPISIAGIAGISGSSITGTYNGDIKVNYIGGVLESVNRIHAAGVLVSGDKDNDITPPLPDEYKTVGSADAASYFGEGSTLGTPDSNKYQLVSKTVGTEYSYYVRHIVCAHTTPTYTPAKAATCTDDGNKEYWYCETCEKYFTTDPTNNPNATSASYNSDIKTKKTGHAYGNWEQYNETQHKRVCANDPEHVEYASHNFKDVVTPATTEAQGYTTHTCTACGYSFVDSYTPVLAPSVEPKSGSGYSKDSTGGYLITALPTSKSGITVAQFKSSLVDGNYTVKNEKGSTVTSGIVKTGYTVEVTGNPTSKVTIVVKGDPSQDGKISAVDFVYLRNHMLKKELIPTGSITFLAADTDGNAKISALDLVDIRNLLLKG